MDKRDLLSGPVRHIDIKAFDSTPIIDGMREMSFTARDTARAAGIFNRMLADTDCTILLWIAGSTSAAGCMQIYLDMVRHNMVDAIVATGATIVDTDFFEALGFRHYRGSPISDDKRLRELYIDRIYDTYIDEEQLQACDGTVREIAAGLDRRPYSSREFIREMVFVEATSVLPLIASYTHTTGVCGKPDRRGGGAGFSNRRLQESENDGRPEEV